MTKNVPSKIQTRSLALRTIHGLKNANGSVSAENIEKAIWEFSTIEDKDFLADILLKEMSGTDLEFDNALAVIFIEVFGEDGEKYAWQFLTKENLPDVKKLFLINLLREMGSKVDFNDMAKVIENSENLLDLETQKFLEMAKMNPEAQIDFLDFFFAVKDEDKKLLLDSITTDFGGDELASILIPIIYADKYSHWAKTCIEALKKTGSYLAFSPLEWVVETSCDETLAAYAKKALNELKISGLRENFSLNAVYKKLLHGSIPHTFWAGMVDGNSNFPVVFSRERKNGTIQTFFVVINLIHGPSACFGFNEVTKDEFEIILSRFFKNSEAAQIPIEEGVKILNYHINKALSEENKEYHREQPYELLCWRQLVLDIEEDSRDLELILKDGLKQVELGEYELRRIVKGDIVNTWFYKYGENKAFDELVDKIILLEKPGINDIENLFPVYLKDIFSAEIDERLLYQAYFNKKAGLVNIASILYSLILPSEIKTKFLNTLLKKSIYEYFLGLKVAKETGIKKQLTFFEKKQEKKEKNVDFDYFISLIESAWTS